MSVPASRACLLFLATSVLIVGCQGTAASTPASVPTSVPTSARPSAPEVKMTAPEPSRFELKEGSPVDIGGGVTVTLKSVMYAHLSDSRNSALMQLVARRGDETTELTLDRLYPAPPKYTAVLGRRVAIDYVDAYHQPSTGAILVLPE